MTYDDFMHYFDKLEICNLGPDVMDDIRDMTGVSVDQADFKRWNTRTHLGTWDSNTAGGCRNYLSLSSVQSFPMKVVWDIRVYLSK